MTAKEKGMNKTGHRQPEPIESWAEGRPVYMPPADVIEHDDAIVVTIDMPGVDEQSLDVKVEENVLSVTGRTSVADPQGYELLHRDYEPGHFERSFTLSSELDREGIKAQLKHGVLSLTLPKSQDTQPKRIKVESA